MLGTSRARRRGMGATGPQILGTTGAVVGTTGVAIATAALPSVGLLAPSLAIAGPIGAAVGGVIALLGAFGVGSGCGQSCIQASNDANAVEDAMKQNLAAFQAGQISRDAALANFDNLWNQLKQACQAIGGGAGQNCVGDRQEGACKWKDSSGQCWNWFIGYRDPIANSSAGLVSTGSSPIFGIPTWALAAGAGLLLLSAVSS